jgi:hypothetical protein
MLGHALKSLLVKLSEVLVEKVSKKSTEEFSAETRKVSP